VAVTILCKSSQLISTQKNDFFSFLDFIKLSKAFAVSQFCQVAGVTHDGEEHRGMNLEVSTLNLI
jgi:hypothetical protein